MARTDKQLSYEERYKEKMARYAEAYRIRTEFASKFKLKPEKTKGYYQTGDPAANIPSGSDSGDSPSGDGTPATTVPGNDNTEKVWNYLAQKGFTAAAAAGVMGNLQQESGINPKKLQYDGGPGTGLCQWEKKHSRGGGRWEQLVAFAKASGRDEWAIETQLDFMWKELTEGYVKHLLDKYWGGMEGLKSTTDYKRAVDAFEKSFERAGRPNMSTRYKYAKGFLDKYGKGNGSGTAATVGTTNSNNSNNNDGSPSARSASIKFQVTRDIRIKDTETTGTELANYDDSNNYFTPNITPLGSIKKGKYVPPSVPRSGYAMSRSEDIRINGFNGWSPLDKDIFIHLAGPQENLYAPEVKRVFQLLRENLEWDKVKVVHGFQPKREVGIMSMHNVGMAMDIYVDNIYDAIYVADTAWTLGIRAIAIGGDRLDEYNPGFVHIDCGPKAFWPLNHHDVYKGPNTFTFTKG